MNSGALVGHIRRSHTFVCTAGGCTSGLHKAKGYCFEHWETDRLARNYGLDFMSYVKLYNDQDGLCAICKTPGAFSCMTRKKSAELGIKRLMLDHCHASGEARGLLCSMCNTGLGYFKDDLAALKRAFEYLGGLA